MTRRIVAILAALALAPLAADAQSYRCLGKDGRRHYGSVVPPECQGRRVEELNSRGVVVRRIDPEGAEKERLLKQATEARKRQEDAAAREATRRNQALLATYTSEKDIEDARARALAENTKAIREVEGRIESIRKRQSEYEKELEFYKGKNEAPAKLRDDIKNATDELKAQEQLLQVKQREVEQINARYDDDKKRYAALGVRR
jgi:DNA repair exonuclease SbcCD ATPase subunit